MKMKTAVIFFLCTLLTAGPLPVALAGGPVDMLHVRDSLLHTQQNLQNQPMASQMDRWNLDRNILKTARKYNYKRDYAWKQAYQATGVDPLKSTGTNSASKYSRAAIGDWDSDVTSRENVEKLVEYFKKKGYTIQRGGGGSVTIKELDSTMFHHTKQGYLSKAAFADNEMMSSFRLGKGELGYKKGYSIELTDNIKKLHGSLDMPTKKLLKPGKLQEMAKSTLRIQDAMDKFQSPGKTRGRSLKQLVDGMEQFWGNPANRNKTFKMNFKEELTLIKGGYSPETLNVIDGNASRAVKEQHLEAFKKKCQAIVEKGFKQHIKVEADIEATYKKQIQRRLKSGNFREAGQIRKEMLRNTAMKNWARDGILSEGNRKVLAGASGFKVETIKHPKTGKPVRTYKPIGQDIPARFKKGGIAGGLNQTQFDRFIRSQSPKEIMNLQGFGKSSSISKQIRISKAEADKFLANKPKSGFLGQPPKGIRATTVSVAGGLLAAYQLYEAGKRSMNETALEITADTTDAELALKVGKHVGKTIYYMTPVAGLVDVASGEYEKAAKEYEEALARGEDPSLAWAVTKGTTKAVGEFSWGVVKSVTVKPVKDLNAIASGTLNTAVDVADMFKAQSSAEEMTARVNDHRNRIGKRKSAVEKALKKMRDKGDLGDPPKDWNRVTPEYVVNNTTAYLEHQMREAQKEYRAAVKAGNGVRTPRANQALKRLNAYVGLVETSIKDPSYGRMIADAHLRQQNLERVKSGTPAAGDTAPATPPATGDLPPEVAAQRREQLQALTRALTEALKKDMARLSAADGPKANLKKHITNLDNALVQDKRYLKELLDYDENQINMFNHATHVHRMKYPEKLTHMNLRINQYHRKVRAFVGAYGKGYNNNDPKHLQAYEQMKKLEADAWYNEFEGISWDLGQIYSYNFVKQVVPEIISLLTSRLENGITGKEFELAMKDIRYNTPWSTHSFRPIEDALAFLSSIHNPDKAAAKTPPAQGTEKKKTVKEKQPQDDPGAFAGAWSTNQEDMVIRVNGNRATGTYNLDGGKIYGTIKGNTLTGRWSENDSKVKCSESFNGSSHWGYFSFTLSGDRLTGNWEYCEGGLPGGEWNGTRKK